MPSQLDRPNGEWIRTIIGSISAIAISLGGIYTVVIVPQHERLVMLEAKREDDRKEFSKLYLLIQTNDEYKKYAAAEFLTLRRDLDKTDAHLLRIDEEQKRRSATITSVVSVEKRLDGLIRRTEEFEQKMTQTYTVGDELKNLRNELQDLRRRIMVPANGKEH